MLRAAWLPTLATLAACAAHPTDPDTTGGAGDARAARNDAGLLAPPDVDAAGRVDGSPAAGADFSLEVPRATAPFTPTGHFRVQIWANAANTHTLLDANGRGAVPMNEARFLWSDGQLYVFFYAGDLDLEAHTTKHDGPVWNDDSIALAFGDAAGDKRIIQISLTGVVADGICPADAADLSDPRCDLRWESHARVGTDADGTLNKLGDNDEEWAVEAAVPLASLKLRPNDAGTRIPFSVSRCEISHDGSRSCGGWGDRPWGSGVLVLEGR
jgi:hypothetical protein